MRLGFVPRLLAVAALVVFPRLVAAQGWQTDFDAARAEAQRLDRPLLVHFWADWCAPCVQMDKTVLNTPEVLGELRTTVVAIKINTDQRQDLANRFGVESLPMDILLEPNGERMIESTGYRPVPEYVALLRRGVVRQRELAKARERAAQAPVVPPKPPVGSPPVRPDAIAGNAVDGIEQTRLTAEERLLPMIDGYCPVSLWETRKWVKGSSEFKSEFSGQIYQLSSAEAKKAFEENPRRFTPRFLGCDPVIVWESDRAVRGTTRFGAFYDDELYLFSTPENRDKFKLEPDRYIRTRIVLRPEHIESVTR
jgi:YHS domain-containing protein/thiol-disulfide isomerase/thioredoxin